MWNSFSTFVSNFGLIYGCGNERPREVSISTEDSINQSALTPSNAYCIQGYRGSAVVQDHNTDSNIPVLVKLPNFKRGQKRPMEYNKDDDFALPASKQRKFMFSNQVCTTNAIFDDCISGRRTMHKEVSGVSDYSSSTSVTINNIVEDDGTKIIEPYTKRQNFDNSFVIQTNKKIHSNDSIYLIPSNEIYQTGTSRDNSLETNKYEYCKRFWPEKLLDYSRKIPSSNNDQNTQKNINVISGTNFNPKIGIINEQEKIIMNGQTGKPSYPGKLPHSPMNKVHEPDLMYYNLNSSQGIKTANSRNNNSEDGYKMNSMRPISNFNNLNKDEKYFFGKESKLKTEQFKNKKEDLKCEEVQVISIEKGHCKHMQTLGKRSYPGKLPQSPMNKKSRFHEPDLMHYNLNPSQGIKTAYSGINNSKDAYKVNDMNPISNFNDTLKKGVNYSCGKEVKFKTEQIKMKKEDLKCEKVPVISNNKEKCPKLTKDIKKNIYSALISTPQREALVKNFAISMKRQDMQTLGKPSHPGMLSQSPMNKKKIFHEPDMMHYNLNSSEGIKTANTRIHNSEDGYKIKSMKPILNYNETLNKEVKYPCGNESLFKTEQHKKKEEDLKCEETQIISNVKEQYPKLTEDIKTIIDFALRPTPQNETLVTSFKLSIKRQDMQTLAGLNWLNDQIINFYLELLQQRGKLNNYPSVYAFNTFFFPKVSAGGHAAVKRWTKNTNIFSNDLIIFPIHMGAHWCVAVADVRKQTLKYYDSLGARNDKCLEILVKYMTDESVAKKEPVHVWKTENVKNLPRQMNGSDCGVFSCIYAEFICRNADLTFSQKDIPYFRHKMIYEIYCSKLLM